MKKVWVSLTKSEYGYSERERSWKLGTVVGTSKLPYSNFGSMKQALEGEKEYYRYLVELDDGNVVEAWEWDTYEPAEVQVTIKKPTNK